MEMIRKRDEKTWNPLKNATQNPQTSKMQRRHVQLPTRLEVYPCYISLLYLEVMVNAPIISPFLIVFPSNQGSPWVSRRGNALLPSIRPLLGKLTCRWERREWSRFGVDDSRWLEIAYLRSLKVSEGDYMSLMLPANMRKWFKIIWGDLFSIQIGYWNCYEVLKF